jgi:SAM-dependent methyltransferase
VNPFTDASSAERYARGRPYFHPLVMARIRERLVTSAGPQLALDAGCGTGLSSRALLAITESVIALDCSLAMLARVPRDRRIRPVVASCEQIPLASQSVDLVAAGCVIHWLNLKLFMSEAHRILKPGGSVVVYDNYFMSNQPEIAGFREWFDQQYQPRYPSPPRNRVPIDDPAVWSAHGFALTHYERYENSQTYSLDRLIDYLVTQSNIISAVEGAREEIGSVRAWLTSTLVPFFADARERRFLYSGPIAILQAV